MQLIKLKFNLWKAPLLAACIFNGLLWVYTWWTYRGATDLVPLHYTIYFGPDLLDYKIKLFTYPLLGLIILGSNHLLAKIFAEERLLVYFLVVAAIIAQIILLLSEISLAVNYY
ncbi:MAG: hypothetical protein A2445_03295 [Candidatus Jacksonbacteria bacterium RIFOXYC2_FULL_44_29]|nr:MAG: hypothetical protein UW45_C0032G0011 [Parcubacteria group bacterium GW2011_GWC2_44_22]OGY75961.1 MAG: hypothetical protein A2240_05740 [Candidatus Jacksonbacteria bacterium RIFOXYA2_FULL_43_12]OGY77001.1 MAG: hypothetical protein A2295_05270 [Candidatus Jacksonbacteria bacterium RIFOXYB2_FULL_44_15]OGY78528.1 MAG: hypothetical protein A2550_02515 [Candidatus Jacksonbacteria bacterium RIFOXYD2_FULL_43_21]OGY79787.1 MAG: hypothetical protein A2445_03295 [Candidatus Jacksonbacteria bacteri